MRILLACLLLAVLLPASAGAGRAGCLPTIERGWVRLAPGMPMGAGFARIRNTCGGAVEIVGASSPDFGDVSLHETRLTDGVSRMRAVAALPLAPGASVELRPGGLHVMLMQPRRAIVAGARVRLEFHLRDGRRVAADLPLRASAP